MAEPLRRARRAASREVRLAWARLRAPRRVTIGPGTDARRGLDLRTGTSGSIDIGRDCVLDSGLVIEAYGRVDVGDRVIFGHHVTIGARDQVTIGADSLIGELVSIRDHDHRFDDSTRPIRDQGAVVARVAIGSDVWVGAKCTVTRGVQIGDHAVVGANSVVTGNVPAWAVAVGAPARVVRFRSLDQDSRPGST